MEVGELGRVGAKGAAGQAQADLAQLCRHHSRLDRYGALHPAVCCNATSGLVSLKPGQAEPMHHHTTPMFYYILQVTTIQFIHLFYADLWITYIFNTNDKEEMI